MRVLQPEAVHDGAAFILGVDAKARIQYSVSCVTAQNVTCRDQHGRSQCVQVRELARVTIDELLGTVAQMH